jgi:hypothetical protein
MATSFSETDFESHPRPRSPDGYWRSVMALRGRDCPDHLAGDGKHLELRGRGHVLERDA